MKRRIICWIVVVSVLTILISSGSALSMNRSTEDIPAWIKGTLMISLLGSEKLLDDADWPTDQYICSFDFSNQTINSIRIPSHAQLMTYKDDPVIVYKRNGIYRPEEVVNRRSAYRTYSVGDVIKSAKGYEVEKYSDLDEFTFSVSPIVVYGIAGEGSMSFGGPGYRSYYYLGYGVSGSGELEYQLLCEKTSGELTVYRSYPLDYFISDIFVSISPSGKIAWRERNENGEADVFVSDGQKVFSLPDEQQYTDSLCWIDDNRLLYTANNTDMSDFRWGDALEIIPRIWHVDTGVIEDLNSTWKNVDVVFPYKLQSVAVDQSKSLVAGYIPPTEEDSNQMGQIVILSLVNGDRYTYSPWNRTRSTHDGLYVNYGKDDKGVVFYNPGAAIDVQLVWKSGE